MVRSLRPRHPRWARMALATLAALSVTTATACGAKPGPTTSDGRLKVVAAFYPLAYAASRIGGDAVTVTDLTKPGVEPHDLELTPKAVAGVSSAGLVVYLHGFQPAVDTAVAAEAPTTALDVTSAASLQATATTEHDAGGATDGHDHDEASDPHFWLDPQRYRAVTAEIADRLVDRLPAQAAAIRAREAAFAAELGSLDSEFANGLAHCANRDLVTGHAAFGYLAQRYGLHEVSVTGLSPDAEPEPAALARIATFVRDNDIHTIYTESQAAPQVGRAVAAETGARLLTLDPIEAVTESSAGSDYFAIQRNNLATLRAGQECS